MEDKIETKIMNYLSAQMRDAVDLQIENLQRVAHGASRECYNLDLRWKEGKTQHYRACLLRRDPTASLLESERDTEFRILRALENSGVPVPKVYWLESDPSVLERPFLIMERLTGEVTPSFGLLAGEDAEMRESLANQAMEILARVHTLDYKKFGLDFLGVPSTPTGFAEAQIDHWEGVVKKASLMGPQPVLTEAILWLRANVPPAEHVTFVHGDFKTDNFMYENGRMKALLDWEMAAIGDPLSDLGWMCLGYYEVGGLCSGMIKREDMISKWEQLTGFKVNEQSLFFWTVFSSVKMAAICLTGGHSFLSGATHSILMALVAYLTPKLLWDITELLQF
jgi:aminoglycoside phosphotransferase (APT) family kinase protein